MTDLRRIVGAVLGVFALDVAAFAQQPATTPRGERQVPSQPAPYYHYPLGSPTTEHRFLTVQEAIAAALANAPALVQARMDEQGAREDVTQLRAARMPQITAPLTYFGTTPSTLRPDGAPSLPSYVASNGVHHTTAFLLASGALDLSGAQRAAIRRSRELLAAAAAGTAAAKRALVLATADAYYGLSLARQKRRLGDETLSLAEGFTETTRDLVGQGKGDEAELLRARAEALRRRDELEQARVGEEAASDLLHTLTGIPLHVHLGVTRPETQLPPPPVSETREAELETRPSVMQADALRRAALEEGRQARAERLPQLSYAVNSGFDASEARPFRSFLGGAAIVGVSVPVFDFGARRSREAQAGLRVESQKAAREAAMRDARQELSIARVTTLAATVRIAQADERAKLTEASLNLLLKRYADGRATFTELVDTQAAYADSRTALYQAITDYDTARLRLESDPSAAPFAAVTLAAASATRSECGRSVSDAPSVAGFRLGMSSAEASLLLGARLPGEDTAGTASVDLGPPDLAALPPPDDPGFHVVHVTLRLTKGRVTYVRVLFSGATTWETKDAFLTAASSRYGLPGPWNAFYDWSRRRLDDPEDLRDLAVECRGFRIRLGLGFFSEGVRRELTPHIKMEEIGAEPWTILQPPALLRARP